MLAAVALFSAQPLLTYTAVQDMSPWLFTAIWYGSRAVLHGGVRQITARRAGQGNPKVVMLADLRAAQKKFVCLLVLFQLSWPLFAVAATLADPAILTVIFEAWPLLFGVITVSAMWGRLMLDTESGTDPVGISREISGISAMLVMLAVGSVGVALVIFSDTTNLEWSKTTLWGVLLALAAAACTAASTAVAQVTGKHQQRTAAQNATAVTTAGLVAAQSLLIPLLLVVSAVTNDMTVTTKGLLLAIAAGAAQMAGGWCLHEANHLARETQGKSSAGINTLYYMVPVAALLLLALSGSTDIARPDLLIAGAAGVVAVNMVMHLDPEGTGTRQGRGGHGYRAVVLALWGAGVLVLFRDDWLPDGWQVWSVVEYWGMVGVLATVFTLIYSFRQARIAELRRSCDDLMVDLHHRLDAMGRDGRLPADTANRAMADLREVDSASRPADLARSYLSLRARLALLVDEADCTADSDARTGLLVDVERFVNLRQQGRGFAEPAVLAMFAAVTAAAAIMVRPDGDVTPFAGWVHDTVSMTVAAAFLFLGFDLIEKRHELDTPTLREVSKDAQKLRGQPPGWRLELVGYADHRVERAVSAALGVVLLVGAVAMLAIKWLG